MGEMLLNGRLYGASGIRELTQAQYDALPDSKYSDGILYCIKDTGIVEGDKYAPIIYSLEEREIGVWTDGKPLYQKTLIPTQLTSDLATETFAINDVDKIVRCNGRITNAADTLCTTAPFLVNNDYRVDFEATVIDATTVRCKSYFGTNSTIYKIKDITIQYTKTTDIPGSGTWGTDGVPMVHYDGNEKVIGTWFGETLYEKTIDCGTLPNTGENSVAHNISNLEKIYDCKGIMVNSSGISAPLPFVPSTSGDFVQIYTTSSNVFIRTNTDRSAYTGYVTIRYTKTS